MRGSGTTSSGTRGRWAASSRAAEASSSGTGCPPGSPAPPTPPSPSSTSRVSPPTSSTRERLAKDHDNIESVRRADESGCILVEDRAVLERV